MLNDEQTARLRERTLKTKAEEAREMQRRLDRARRSLQDARDDYANTLLRQDFELEGRLEGDEYIPAWDIHDACYELAAIASSVGRPITMDFNERVIVAQPGDTPDALYTAWYTLRPWPGGDR